MTQTLGRLFKDNKNHSLEEMHKLISDSSKVRLHPKSKTVEDAKRERTLGHR